MTLTSLSLGLLKLVSAPPKKNLKSNYCVTQQYLDDICATTEFSVHRRISASSHLHVTWIGGSRCVLVAF